MGLIKNYEQLATTSERKAVLQMIEAGLMAIQPAQVIDDQFVLTNGQLVIAGNSYKLENFDRVFLIGFGKGSAKAAQIIEEKLRENNKYQGGWVIDTEDQISNLKSQISKIQYTAGTHPLPSEQNWEFTKKLVSEFEGKLTEKDLVLVVICGGGSAMLMLPHGGQVEQIKQINQALLKSGATIGEINTVRKKLDGVKGGGLAKILYPATVAALIFSDVPGNNLAVIASGPTVLDPTTVEEAWAVAEKYSLSFSCSLRKEDLKETPKEEKYFRNVANILVLSNLTAIQAMGRTAEGLGYQVTIHSAKLEGEAREVGSELIKLISDLSGHHKVILVGGETTVTVKGGGKGGRNQELVLGGLLNLGSMTPQNQIEISRGHPKIAVSGSPEGIVLASFDSDGWDNSELAGAIADEELKNKSEKLNINPREYLENNDAYAFFEKVGDGGIVTGRLPSNVSDLMIVLKN